MDRLYELLDLYNPDSNRAENMSELLLETDAERMPDFLEDFIERFQAHPNKSNAKIAIDVLAPLAARINMQAMKRELENLAFEVLHPEQDVLIKKLLNSKEADTKKPLLKFIYELEKSLEKASVTTKSISGRMKQPYSLYKKLRKSGTISDIHDLLAVRVIVDTEDQCYEVLDVINAEFTPILERFKDYIKQPKENGYRSLHGTVNFGKHTVEVQIRTQKMHDFAEGGAAAHWHYDRHKHTKGYRRGLAARILPSNQQDSVFVFSPNGDPYRLKKGATALDFAFAVHTGVGLRTKQVRVNDAISTLDYQLQNGDKIEILTGKEAQPKRDWLRIVSSKKAQGRIRTWLREADRDRYRDIGKTMFDEAFDEYSSDTIDTILHEYSLVDIDDLFVAIGAGYISPDAIRQRLRAPQQEPTQDAFAGKAQKKAVAVAGMEGLQYRFAQCCDPTPPEGIVGYITRSLGITVHRDGCSELRGEQERVVPCHWL